MSKQYSNSNPDDTPANVRRRAELESSRRADARRGGAWRADARYADARYGDARRADAIPPIGEGAHRRAPQAQNQTHAHRQPSDARREATHELGRPGKPARQAFGATRKVVTIIASIIYWPIAIIGVASPFMEGFNPGGLYMWQVLFSRFWLAFVLLGFAYALAIDLGGIRDARPFRKQKPLRIALALILDIAVSFVAIRAVCML